MLVRIGRVFSRSAPRSRHFAGVAGLTTPESCYHLAQAACARSDRLVARITSATTAKFLAIQKASKESEKLFFQGVERKFDAAEEARRKEIAVERDRTNAEFRKIAEALKTQRASTNEEFRKIAQAAQERRSNSKK